MSNKFKKKPGGIALVLTLLSLLIISVLGLGLVTIMLGESSATSLQVRESKSYYLACAGVARATAELRRNSTWGTSSPVTASMGEGQYEVTVWASPNNSTSSYKLWKVTTRGRAYDSSREIVAWVEQESFAKYAMFTDSEKSSDGTTIWYLTRDSMTGPVHTNGYYSISGIPRFSDRVTAANTSDSYYNSTYRRYSQGGHYYYDPAYFYRYSTEHGNENYNSNKPMALEGSASFSFQGGQPRITLPTDTGLIASRANTTFNDDVAITFNDDGTMTVHSGASNTTLSTQTTTIQVNGDADVHGTLAGRTTIGCSGDINIVGDIVYNDKTQDVLGLVAQGTIWIKTSSNVKRDLEIDAVLMALNNSMTVENYDRGVARGTLRIFGGVIQRYRGAVGTFNTNSNQVASGYSKEYVYDQKLLNKPPLNFPVTGEIKIKAWQDRGALAE
ncbi:MAG: DUF4900 domain-containing protein [bacterium]